jgi:hypothetical protein
MFIPMVLALTGCKKDTSSAIAPDLEPPSIVFLSPTNNTAVGDTIKMRVNATDNTGISKVEFYVNGVNISGSGIAQPPYKVDYIPQGIPLGDQIRLYAKAVDQAGNSKFSDTIHVAYKWFIVIEDSNEGWSRNIKTVYARSTSDRLDFRVETNGPWIDPHSDSTGIDCAIFLDTDRNPNTGLSPNLTNWYDVNDIGPDYVAVVGWEGDSLWRWNSADTTWNRYRGFPSLQLQSNINSFEVSIRLSDIGNPPMIDLVVANIAFRPFPPQWDWAPNQGHVSYRVEPNYLGKSVFHSNGEHRTRSSIPHVRLLLQKQN